MRTLITGASGFIGQRLAERWSESGGTVFGLDSRFPENQPFPLFYTVDLLKDCIRNVLRDCQPDTIIHLAGLSHVPDSIQRPVEYTYANTIATLKLLDAVRLWRSDGAGDINPTIIIAGSGEEYGYGERIADEQAPAPRTPYAASKAAATALALGYAHTYGMDIRVIRPATVYGPGQRQKFIPSVIETLLDGRDVQLHYGGGMQRSWLYIDDLCDAIAVVRERGRGSEIYNLVGYRHTNGMVANLIREILMFGTFRRSKLGNLVKLGDFSDAPLVDMSGRKAFLKLGWQPTTLIEAGLTQTITAFLKSLSRLA